MKGRVCPVCRVGVCAWRAGAVCSPPTARPVRRSERWGIAPNTNPTSLARLLPRSTWLAPLALLIPRRNPPLAPLRTTCLSASTLPPPLLLHLLPSCLLDPGSLLLSLVSLEYLLTACVLAFVVFCINIFFFFDWRYFHVFVLCLGTKPPGYFSLQKHLLGSASIHGHLPAFPSPLLIAPA